MSIYNDVEALRQKFKGRIDRIEAVMTVIKPLVARSGSLGPYIEQLMTEIRDMLRIYESELADILIKNKE